MKVETIETEQSNFKPIELKITIESAKDLHILFALGNVAEGEELFDCIREGIDDDAEIGEVNRADVIKSLDPFFWTLKDYVTK